MTETIEGFHVEYDIILTQVYTFKKLEHVVVNGNLVFWDLPKCCLIQVCQFSHNLRSSYSEAVDYLYYLKLCIAKVLLSIDTS